MFSDALSAVGQELHPQHGMAVGECGRRSAKRVGIDGVTVELDVEMPCHPTELLIALTTHPHGVLHGRQREWRVVGRIILSSNGLDRPPDSASSASEVATNATHARRTARRPTPRSRRRHHVGATFQQATSSGSNQDPDRSDRQSGSTSSVPMPRSSATSSRTVSGRTAATPITTPRLAKAALIL